MASTWDAAEAEANLTPSGAPTELKLDISEYSSADLSSATAATIIDLRNAFALQRWLEINARSGSRYTEFLQAHYGVKPQDFRLQRPEYIGGSKARVKFSEVLQTGETTSTSPLGNYAGHGIAIDRSAVMKYRRYEFGWYISIFSARPNNSYFQGLPKKLTRFDRFDYPFPEFAHIGDEEIFNRELYVGSPANQRATWGYTLRFADIKYIPSRVHGKMKTAALLPFNLALEFDTLPPLAEDFIECNPRDYDRIFAVQGQGEESTEQLYVEIYQKLHMKRTFPYFSNPMMVG